MQTTKKQLNKIFASWALAGFWFLALIGMSVLSSPYQTSQADIFASDTSSIERLASSQAKNFGQES